MALELRDCTFFGSALPEPFVKYQLESLLQKRGLLPKSTGSEGKALFAEWEIVRRKLRLLGEQGGEQRVKNHVLEPLLSGLGYARLVAQEPVATREGNEPGGWLLLNADGTQKLRAWTVPLGTDLDAPSRRGYAYRFSPGRMAGRVLHACGERVGLLTDGEELRILLSDPARPESHIAVNLTRASGWRDARTARDVPDSYRLLKALASTEGVPLVSELTEEARLSQTNVTEKLRRQARLAVEGFVQGVLDHPANAAALAGFRVRNLADPVRGRDALARDLWQEGLLLIYRLLFVFKLESSADPARAFSFASTTLWRNTYSPNMAFADIVRRRLDHGADTGAFLEEGLRALFRLFSEGLSSSELQVAPLGGMLFGRDTSPVLDDLRWGEAAAAHLLDCLLWTPGDGRGERERVHYGALDVEDLGRVYEALLELEPGIATEPMCRLRRDKLEVVLPEAQGEQYRTAGAAKTKTKVEWVEAIPPGRFYLRVGLGRKASGSYYTPHPFVRFLVQETVMKQAGERSPRDEPNPSALLNIKVLDPAMGSGHFLVEACRRLGEALYEACRLCDERALEEEHKAEEATDDAARRKHLAAAAAWRKRVEDLPDPDDELVQYLPSRAPEGEESGLSEWKALALSRRLVAVHCLYGVDKNRLAVELAKLSLWLESYAEGLPLTFLDHRLICGDSLTGPFFEHMLTLPGTGEKLDGLFAQGVTGRLRAVLADALLHVQALETSVGTDVADLEVKREANARLDSALLPLRLLAAAWSGGVMLGKECDDQSYLALVSAVAAGEATEAVLATHDTLRRMVEVGREGVPYDLTFPEVFHPGGTAERTGGFDAVVGNPPWDRMLPADKEFFASLDMRVLDAATKRERDVVEERLRADPAVSKLHGDYIVGFRAGENLIRRGYRWQSADVGGKSTIGKQDIYRVFMERGADLLRRDGLTGILVPSAFHANEGATGVRRLYLEHLSLRCCYSFENRKKLFDIDSRFKFATIVASHSGGGTGEFRCAFYLHDMEWLFQESEPLTYTLEFVRRTGGEYLSFLELRSPRDAEVAKTCFASGASFGDLCALHSIRLGRELNMTDDAWRFTPVEDVLPGGEDPRDPDVAVRLREQGYLALHEGKTFHQYTDHWEDRPRYVVGLSQLAEKPDWIRPARFYRVAFRDIASSTNERTAIFGLVPPGSVFGNTAPCERLPDRRPSGSGLLLMALADSHSFDWTLRQKSAAHVNLFILNGCPVPALSPDASRFLAHAALRLTCNHAGYAPLWEEQLGDRWREPAPPRTWPVLEGDDARWAVRAAIDAVVAQAYGLSREQYAHVLSSFSHTSYPAAPERCLAGFDELVSLGLDSFTRKHDPYFDVPLVTTLPKPVITFATLTGAASGTSAADRPLVDARGQYELNGLVAADADPEGGRRGRKHRKR